MTPLPTQLMKENFMAEDILLVDGNGEKVDTQKIGLRQNHKIITQAGLKDNQERTIISKFNSTQPRGAAHTNLNKTKTEKHNNKRKLNP